MTYPWEQPKPEPNKLGPLDLAEDENGVPFFLKRVKRLDGTIEIGWDALQAHQMDVYGVMHGQQIDAQEQTPTDGPQVWPFNSST